MQTEVDELVPEDKRRKPLGAVVREDSEDEFKTLHTAALYAIYHRFSFRTQSVWRGVFGDLGKRQFTN